MTIQLIQAPSDTHLWAESYDRDANDVVELPQEAAQTIAGQLHRAVLHPSTPRFVLPEAHDAYLHGRYLWFTDHNDRAGEYFKKATELQPDYSLGWSGLSVYYGAGAVEGQLDPQQSLPAEDLPLEKELRWMTPSHGRILPCRPRSFSLAGIGRAQSRKWRARSRSIHGLPRPTTFTQKCWAR